MTIAITGGTVVTAIDAVLADVLIDGEIVVGVVHPDSELSRSFAGSADQVIDATGMYLVPGGIDAHTHLQATGQIAPVLETFEAVRQPFIVGEVGEVDDCRRAPEG